MDDGFAMTIRKHGAYGQRLFGAVFGVAILAGCRQLLIYRFEPKIVGVSITRQKKGYGSGAGYFL